MYIPYGNQWVSQLVNEWMKEWMNEWRRHHYLSMEIDSVVCHRQRNPSFHHIDNVCPDVHNIVCLGEYFSNYGNVIKTTKWQSIWTRPPTKKKKKKKTTNDELTTFARNSQWGNSCFIQMFSYEWMYEWMNSSTFVSMCVCEITSW